MAISSGSSFPSGVEFAYIPIDLSTIKQENALGCAKPFPLKLDTLFEQNAGSNVLFVSVPGAFTPTCTENHIPPFLDDLSALKTEKNISAIVILSANDPFVLNAWGKLLLKDAKFNPESTDLPKVIFASDPNAKFSQDNGISLDLTEKGLGIRTGRYAFVVNADSKTVSYYGVEAGAGVEASGLDAVKAAKL
ncbi:hypothetical protein JCM33374_g4151 [Metschnikowia sp. JCM 33374]|nr:hypothetical protein JCM33374_g4151 [Metschnikowia sp. JCM 33374]